MVPSIPCSLTKKELSERLRISRSSLASLLNVELFAELAAIGYEKTNHILNKRQLEIVDKHFGL
jgi:hypothetical protein